MNILRYLAFVTLGTVLCIGCSESTDTKPQTWEKKPAANADKTEKADKGEKSDKVASSENPHGMADSSGTANPHGSMGGMMAPFAGGQSGPAATIENDGKLEIGKAHWTVSKKWVRKQPKMNMIEAEFAFPKAEGDPADGRLTVMHAGGSTDDNVNRWKGQFEKLDKDKQETLDVGGVKVALVDLNGAYMDGGMMGPKTSRPDYRMLAAIYEEGEQALFIKAYGPAKTMAAHADEFKDFVRSYKADK